MRLIDSHAHLDFEDFHEDFAAVLYRATEAGIIKIVNIGADLDRSRASVVLADNYPDIFATVGIHPDEADNVDFTTIHNELLDLAKSSKKVIGIGETGLDYYFPVISTEQGERRNLSEENLSTVLEMTKTNQQKLFRIHIDVARHLGLPLVIHIRNGENEEAVNDAYEILKKTGYGNGVIHCFTLNADWAKRFVQLGFYIGFTGIITYKNAEEIRGAVFELPLERILVETDCPFLAPQKHRGQRNEPAYVVEVAEKVAEIKGISVQGVADATTMNAEELFGI